MMRIGTSLLLSALSCVYSSASRADASSASNPAAPKLHVVLVSLDESQAPVVPDALLEELGGPVVAPGETADRLGLHFAVEADEWRGLVRDFEHAEDVFFSGEHRESRALFGAIAQELAARPEMLVAGGDALREVGFKAAVQLGVLAKAEGEGAVEVDWLRRAALGFPEVEARPLDFPPWVRERIAGLRRDELAGTPRVIFEHAADCRAQVDGRSLAPDTPVVPLLPGRHAARLDCAGAPGPGPVQRFEVARNAEEIIVRPLALRHSTLRLGERFPALVVAADATEEEWLLDAQSLRAAVGSGRMLLVVGTSAGQQRVVLIDERRAGPLRSAELKPLDPQRRRAAAAVIAGVEARAAVVAGGGRPEPSWYRDPLAWSLIGLGVAGVVTGVVLGQVYGTPTPQEPYAYLGMIGGAGLTVTGGALLFVSKVGRPVPDDEETTAKRSGMFYRDHGNL